MQKRFLIWENPRDAVLTIVLCLMFIGCVNVFSASFVSASAMFGTGYYYLYRYFMFGLLGIFSLVLVGWKIDYHIWLKYRTPIFYLFLALLLCVDLFGTTTKGAQRWLVIAGFSFQPSEFVKLAVIIMGSGSLGSLLKRGKVPDLLHFPVNVAFIQSVILAGMVLIQPDMGTAAIILALMIVLYVIAGLPLKELGTLAGICAAGVVVMIAMAPYRLSRILIWLDPWRDAQGSGYQSVQSFVSIGSGGWFGNHFGMGTGKFFFLPEAHTDFAFAIFCQEWGFFGALGLLFLFLVLAKAIYTIGKNTTDEKGFLLVTGVNFLVVGQAIANMAMVCGILPVIGVPLSFISYGGTSLIATLGAVGLVVSVYNDEVKKSKVQKTKVQNFSPKSARLGRSQFHPRGVRK
jgi:cell division protein FtsW